MDIESLKATLKDVKVDAKANEKELKGISNYLNPDEVPMLFFNGLVKSQSKKVLLTNSRVLFVSSGMFSGIEITDIPLQKINNVTSGSGIMFGKITISDVSGNAPTAIDTPMKDAASRFATLYTQLMQASKETTQNSVGINEEQVRRLDMLFDLKEKGAISEEEYKQEKGKILGETKQVNEYVSTPIASASTMNAPVVPNKAEKGKKSGCLTRILQVIGLIFLLAFVMRSFENKDSKTDKDASQPTPKTYTAPETPSGKVTVNLNTGETITSANRKKGSKAFIKQDGTPLFKESGLKNSLGELMRGTELRVLEGANGSSKGLPVRYKVQIMSKGKGKGNKVGWVIEENLADPVQIQAKQKQGFGDYSSDFLRGKEDIARKIINNICDEGNVVAISSIPQVDGSLALDIRIKLKDVSFYGEDAILRYYLNDARSLMKKLFTHSNLKEFNEIRLYGSFPMRDRYGNVSDEPVTKFIMKRRLAEKIRWDNFPLREFHALMLTENNGEDCVYWVHRALGNLK